MSTYSDHILVLVILLSNPSPVIILTLLVPPIVRAGLFATSWGYLISDAGRQLEVDEVVYGVGVVHLRAFILARGWAQQRCIRRFGGQSGHCSR